MSKRKHYIFALALYEERARGLAHVGSVVSSFLQAAWGRLAREGSLSCDLPKAMQSPQLESWNLNLGALGTKGRDRSGLCYGMLRKTFRSYSLHFKKLNIKNHFP